MIVVNGLLLALYLILWNKIKQSGSDAEHLITLCKECIQSHDDDTINPRWVLFREMRVFANSIGIKLSFKGNQDCVIFDIINRIVRMRQPRIIAEFFLITAIAYLSISIVFEVFIKN